MYDLIVRNGTVIDGTGKERFTADIAISDGRIAKIGAITESAEREIEAGGKLVTPGWVDIHTHYVELPGTRYLRPRAGTVLLR